MVTLYEGSYFDYYFSILVKIWNRMYNVLKRDVTT